ncbi:hypothetical protein WA158_005779 [Blastocystis sp. Blastoise]
MEPVGYQRKFNWSIFKSSMGEGDRLFHRPSILQTVMLAAFLALLLLYNINMPNYNSDTAFYGALSVQNGIHFILDTASSSLRSDKIKTSLSRDIDITLATHSTIDQLLYLHYVEERWPGKINIAICSSFNDSTIAANSLSLTHSNRIHISMYITEDPDRYPINILRNIAIQSVRTTYFLMIDIDVIPSVYLYEHSLLYLSSISSFSHTFMYVIPYFETQNTLPNKSCAQSTEQCQLEKLKEIPVNKKHLKRCLKSQFCLDPFRKDSKHSYIPDAFFLKKSEAVSIGNTIQYYHEPYFIIEKSSFLPIYNEALSIYEGDRYEYIIHLYCKGYKPVILNQEFLVHLSHPISIIKRKIIRDRLSLIPPYLFSILSHYKLENDNIQHPLCQANLTHFTI